MNIFAFFGLWFWVLISVYAGVIIYLVEDISEEKMPAVWTSLGLFAALYFLGGENEIIQFLQYIKNEPFDFIMQVVGYLILGVVWSFVRWILFLKEEYKHNKERLQASKYTSQLASWVSFWPLSLLWFIIKFPIEKVVPYIVKNFGGMYQKVSDSIWAKINRQD